MTVLEGRRHTLVVDTENSALQLHHGLLADRGKFGAKMDTFPLSAHDIESLRRRLEEMGPEGGPELEGSVLPHTENISAMPEVKPPRDEEGGDGGS